MNAVREQLTLGLVRIAETPRFAGRQRGRPTLVPDGLPVAGISNDGEDRHPDRREDQKHKNAAAVHLLPLEDPHLPRPIDQKQPSPRGVGPCALALVEEHSAGALGAEGEREMNRCEWPGGHYLNDDKSPLIGLLSCIVCKETMNLEGSVPDAEGKDIIQYRCKRCGRIERVRLLRRNRDAAG